MPDIVVGSREFIRATEGYTQCFAGLEVAMPAADKFDYKGTATYVGPQSRRTHVFRIEPNDGTVVHHSASYHSTENDPTAQARHKARTVGAFSIGSGNGARHTFPVSVRFETVGEKTHCMVSVNGVQEGI